MKSQKSKTIYAIHCKKSNRTYIGCSANFENRIYQHFNELANGFKTMRISKGGRDNTPWQKDYNQYGRDAFDVYILERNVPAEAADVKETEYILKYRANDPNFGYNIRPIKRSTFTIIEGMPPLPLLAAQAKEA